MTGNNLYVTQDRSGTILELGDKLEWLPSHIPIIQTIYETNWEYDNVFIADLYKILIPDEIKRLKLYSPSSKIFHCGLLQPAHCILAYSDQNPNVIIANDFGTAGEVLTVKKDGEIYYSERGLNRSIGLYATLASERLGITVGEFMSLDYETVEFKDICFREKKNAVIPNLAKAEAKFYLKTNKLRRLEVKNKVRSMIDNKLKIFNLSDDWSYYGEIFYNQKNVSLLNTIIPRRMEEVQARLKSF